MIEPSQKANPLGNDDPIYESIVPIGTMWSYVVLKLFKSVVNEVIESAKYCNWAWISPCTFDK